MYAILIGFSYDKSSEQLPGILIDLYLAYNYCINTLKCQNISVITDINKDQSTKLLLTATLQGIVDSNILNFIESLKSKNQYYNFENKTFIKHLVNICYNKQRLFIYYTGHFKDNKFILPKVIDGEYTLINSENYLTIDQFRSILLKTAITAEIFIILDCCNCNGLNLPYRLQLHDDLNSIYRLTSYKPLFFCKQKIICLSSSKENESSLASKTGSVFTSILFSNIGNIKRSLTILLKSLYKEYFHKYNQTPTIDSNYPDIYHLWSWIFNEHDHYYIHDYVIYPYYHSSETQ
jgi:hypothetical protein